MRRDETRGEEEGVDSSTEQSRGDQTKKGHDGQVLTPVATLLIPLTPRFNSGQHRSQNPPSENSKRRKRRKKDIADLFSHKLLKSLMSNAICSSFVEESDRSSLNAWRAKIVFWSPDSSSRDERKSPYNSHCVNSRKGSSIIVSAVSLMSAGVWGKRGTGANES